MDQQSSAVKQGDHHDQSPGSPPINLLKDSLPSGFKPTETYLAELLERKFASKDTSLFDFYSYDPEDWNLAPAQENIHHHDDGNTYVFSPSKAKFAGGVIIRDTPSGFWMRTGRSATVIEDGKGEQLGCKGVLNFFIKKPDGYDEQVSGGRRVPKRRQLRTEVQTLWQMHEICLIPKDNVNPGMALCVAYKTKPVIKKPKKKKKVKTGEDDASSTGSWTDSDWDTDTDTDTSDSEDET